MTFKPGDRVVCLRAFFSVKVEEKLPEADADIPIGTTGTILSSSNCYGYDVMFGDKKAKNCSESFEYEEVYNSALYKAIKE